MPSTVKPSLVLIDLDDTLFDHRHSTEEGLRALMGVEASLRSVPETQLLEEHTRQIRVTYDDVLNGRRTIHENRRERFAGLLSRFGARVDDESVLAAIECYRTAYEKSRRAVPGARELLSHLHETTCVGVVTNGRNDLQREKLEVCYLDTLVHFVLTSESAGVQKPAPAIFHRALRLGSATPESSVMVGDSWEADVVGASGVGIRAVWLNRLGDDLPDGMLAVEVTGLEPVEEVLQTILLDSD